MANTGILGIVIGKLRHGKKLYSIILLKVNKGLEVDFHCAILLFGLTFYLRVKGGEESLLHAMKIA